MTEFKGLSGNALKIIAAVCMVIDHVGVMFFQQAEVLRILGRLAFPIFAFMIAEGCRYTKNRGRYLGMLAGLAAVCQVTYYLTSRDLYMCILVTFSLSVLVIIPLQNLKAAQRVAQRLLWGAVTAAAVAGVWLVNRRLIVDYGFWGSMVPVFAAVLQGRGKEPAGPWDRTWVHVLMLGVGLLLLALDMGGVQMYSLAAVPVLLLYSGRRGKWKMKYFFYVFYPAHLVLLQGLQLVLK